MTRVVDRSARCSVEIRLIVRVDAWNMGQITETYPRMPNPYCFIPPLLFHTPEGYDPVIINRTGI